MTKSFERSIPSTAAFCSGCASTSGREISVLRLDRSIHTAHAQCEPHEARPLPQPEPAGCDQVVPNSRGSCFPREIGQLGHQPEGLAARTGLEPVHASGKIYSRNVTVTLPPLSYSRSSPEMPGGDVSFQIRKPEAVIAGGDLNYIDGSPAH